MILEGVGKSSMFFIHFELNDENPRRAFESELDVEQVSEH